MTGTMFENYCVCESFLTGLPTYTKNINKNYSIDKKLVTKIIIFKTNNK